LQVIAVSALDLIHSGFAINSVYGWVVHNFDNPTSLLTSPWSFTFEPLLTGVTAVVRIPLSSLHISSI
jgi:hypothetical protein